ncbi:MAG: hypothetical protein LLF83_11145 [Methanobacterium sp.]|nr:hypothetical protein [Methanobacterium sp.]
MRKRILGAISTIPALAALALSGISNAASCPYGMVDCTGQCGRFIDGDGNGICDLSLTSSSTSDTLTSQDPANTDNSQTTTPDNLDHGNTNATTDPGNDGSGGFFGDGDTYYILPISLLLIIGYLFTYYLFKKGILKRNKQKRIWNLLLTAGYIGTSGTGIILAILINLGIKTALNPSINFWHAELSILMVIGTLIHVHIYWKSFKNMFRVLFGFKSPISKDRNPLNRKRETPEILVNSIKK